jgi:glycyl-tRNA synthetase
MAGARTQAARRLAPVKVAILPLVRRDGMPDKGRAVYDAVRRRFFADYDEGGSIGRRYRRQDEIGTPWCATMGSQTLKDDTVTIRDRDTMQQIRLPSSGICDWLSDRLESSRECRGM